MADRAERPFRLVVGMTGATGSIYGIRLLQVLLGKGVETHLVMSHWARKTIIAETALHPDQVGDLATHVYEEEDRAAPLATSSFRTDGMIVVPCSMRSLAALAGEIPQNLIHRAALVAMEERRKLLLVVRESPLSVIHLENMLKVARRGVLVVPPLPAFYTRPASLEDIIDHTVGRLLDLFGIDHDLVRRWGEPLAGPGRVAGDTGKTETD
jgi:flavin prenyltransferase